MSIESEHLVEHDSYTAEEIAGTVLQIAIKQKYIKRENLTAKGELLLSAAEKYESGDDDQMKLDGQIQYDQEKHPKSDEYL